MFVVARQFGFAVWFRTAQNPEGYPYWCERVEDAAVYRRIEDARHAAWLANALQPRDAKAEALPY